MCKMCGPRGKIINSKFLMPYNADNKGCTLAHLVISDRGWIVELGSRQFVGVATSHGGGAPLHMCRLDC